MAETLGAKAFTNQADIYFNRGEYHPDTAAGIQLLAHELSHVKQQQTVPGLQYRLQVPAERDRYEEEADRMADEAVNSPGRTMEQTRVAPSVSHNGGDSLQLAKAKPEADTNADPNWLLEKVGGLVRNIPGYNVLTLVIGRDPISGQAVKGDSAAVVKFALAVQILK